MTARIFILKSPAIRRRCAAFIVEDAPEGFTVRIDEPKKSRDQECKYHAMLGDIAPVFDFLGQKGWPLEDTKRILVDAFAKAMQDLGTPLSQQGRVIPSMDGLRTVQLGVQTRNFRKREARDFIEFLYAWGAEHGVEWSDESKSVIQAETGRPMFEEDVA